VSRYDYQTSTTLENQDHSFTALLMATMREAPDIETLDKLRDAFPDIWSELDARRTSPGGYLPGETAGAA
jgi:hypothetical protein